MQESLGLDATSMGMFDVAMFVPYALVQAKFGWVPDRFGPRRTFGVCLLVSAASMVTFGWWTSLPVLLLLATINGGAQSLCWATGVKALAATLDEPERSRAVGIYATSTFGGGILASALAARLLSGADWTAIFTLPSIIVAVLGGVVLAGLQVGGATGHGSGNSAAAKEGAADATAVSIGDASNGNGTGGSTAPPPAALTSTQLIRIPMVLEVRAPFCQKGLGALLPR
jgi:sugar phosphate permease